MDPQPKLDPDCDPQHAARVKGTSAGVKMPLPIRISRLTVAVQAKKSWMVPGVLLTYSWSWRESRPTSEGRQCRKARWTQAGNGRADHCGGNAVPDGKAPVGKHEVERQYDQEDAEDQDQHLQIQGGGQKDGKGAARDVDQQGKGQPPEGEYLLRKRKARE